MSQSVYSTIEMAATVKLVIACDIHHMGELEAHTA